MTPFLLEFLCDPISKDPLDLKNARTDGSGNIVSGALHGTSGYVYPILNGIPRFTSTAGSQKGTEPFGDQWNHFNFTDFYSNWLHHTVANTFGSTTVFRDRIVVDAGAGSGAQSLWILRCGAKHVIALELSSAVDGVIRRNLESSGHSNYDIVQCSIDRPPFKDRSVDGIVICHNVIQHTPSVEDTARALYAIVGQGGELVFNCYRLNDEGIVRWVRFHLIFRPLRAMLQRLPFAVRMAYARVMALLRFVPVVGMALEKSLLCVRGDISIHKQLSWLEYLKMCYRSTVLNTFDCFGAHRYQHYKSDVVIANLVTSLQPDSSKVSNFTDYFKRPEPIGCALRIRR